MHAEPLLNEPDDPFVSVLIYNYDGQQLKDCFDCIFRPQALRNFEVVYLDDASIDGSWEIASKYADMHAPLVSLVRNRMPLGPQANRTISMQMARGRYCALLTAHAIFDPVHVQACVRAMESDPHARFENIRRTVDVDPSAFATAKGPLVSILCYNYNYGCYLSQCLESVFKQTYENIELIFADNASTDDSWKIAMAFARRYPAKMSLARNRKNYGPDANLANGHRLLKGKYFARLCSDDVLEPTFVEQCVHALEAHPYAGMAIVNRAMIDENGRRTEEPAFYNRSCIVPGEEQAAVYMMAGVNPSVSQIMYRHDAFIGRDVVGSLAARYYGARVLDFNISLDYDVAYIKNSLLLHRIHSQSDTNAAEGNLLPIFGMYVLNHQLADLATVRGLKKVSGRLPDALDKLAKLAIRYSVRALLEKNEYQARKYFDLAMAINPQTAEDPAWGRLQTYWTSDSVQKAESLAQLGAHDNLAARNISYDPPPGSISI